MNQTYSKHDYNATTDFFVPLRFSFCENAQSALPLVALQYHDVELRITWGTIGANVVPEVYAQFIHLDTDERTVLSSTPQNMLITQTQKAIKSGSGVQEVNFNHPMKYLVAKNTTGAITTAKMKLQINGTDVADAKSVRPHFTYTSVYYHTQNATASNDVLLVPFCIDTAKLQPTGTLNFSRLDSARLVVDNNDTFEDDVYGVNYNILRIENGMGGLMYSN